MVKKTVGAGVIAAILCSPACFAQRRPMDVPDPTQTSTPQHRQRLILKDGTYQIVLSYQVVGKIVRYQSAERGGDTEELPLALVDLRATEGWQREHSDGAAPQTSVLSPELAREEADRAALTPEIAPNLHLPEEDSVLVLDTFQGTPELVPLPQQGSDLNKETGHAVQKKAIDPSSVAHRIEDLRGTSADVQLHVPDPVFYVRLGMDETAHPGSSAFTVDTHSVEGRDTPTGGAVTSNYILERVDVRYDSRVVDSLRLWQLGTGKPQPDIIELKTEALPGGHWLKLTPTQPLEFGEYALMELLSANDVNLDVWDFGIHPTAPENVEVQRPVPPRPATLQHR